MADLETVLKDINKNKSRDPDGINRSIFHLDCIGSNLKQSFLNMVNEMKNKSIIPEFMKKAIISTIPKSGSKFVLKNERGIFVLSAIRTIFMRLLYNTKYNIIDQNMSDSNVGGRKKMSSVFILNGIIHETLSSKHNTPVTLLVYDYTQMFDSMDLEESVGDMFDSGVKDDTLALLYNANTNIKVKVKTPAGLSEEMTFKKLVLQVDTWGPTMAANQVDTIGKQLLVEQPQFLYKYKGHVPIGILGMIDDIVGVSEHGFNATQLNAFINIKTAEKKLKFGHNKCKTLTISHKNVNYVKSDLLIDHWVESHDKSDQLVETFKGKIK